MNRTDIEDIYELSPLQQGMLLHSRYGGDSDTYLAQRVFTITGPLDADRLELVWQQVTDAHTILRTSFHWDGLDKPLQVVHRRVPVTVGRHDWSELDGDRQRERLDQLAAAERGVGFDLERPPLQRLALIRLGAQRHAFIWTHHLLLLDGWSVTIVLDELVRRYLSLTLGVPPPDPAPPYRSYIAWLQRQDLAAAKDFWTQFLSGLVRANPPALLLPTQREGGPGPVHEVSADFPPDAQARLRDMAARHHVTLSTVIQAAWALVLQRYTADSEVILGVTTSGRPPELAQVERMVGLFTNSLPVPVAVPDDAKLGPWLREVQARCAAARRYEYSPLSEVKKWAGAPGPRPLFHSLVVVDNYPLMARPRSGVGGLSLYPVAAFEKTSEPLTLLVTPALDTIRLLHHRDRLPAGAAERLLAYFRATLDAMVDADRIVSVALATAAPPDGRGRGEVVRYPDADQTLPELVERRARAEPDQVALISDEGTLTFGELYRRALAVAAAVRRAGAGPGAVVGVCAERSPELVAGVLGAQFAGAAYLPLEPSLPVARLALMVREAGATVVLTRRQDSATAERIGARHVVMLDGIGDGGTADRVPVSGADPAYVIYTSGSTGRPKGVVITHEAIVNRLLWMQQTFRLTAADRVLHKTPFGFDVSVWELFWPLLTGATMVLARPGGHQDAAYLAETIARHQVTVAHFVPSMLQLFLDEPGAARLPALRRVICSGEALAHGLARRCRAVLPGVELHNLYGPTEAAVDVTWWDCARPAPPGVVPIGEPIANTDAYVLDRRLLPVADGVPGELYLGGVQLARGYVNRPGLTAERFVAHPLAGPGGRLYRTGDRVRRLPDGSLEYLGRLDHQVKIHGYRIELGEVEHVLADHPDVRQAVVVARAGPDGPQLAAYVAGACDADRLREHLRQRLPRYMVPAVIEVLDALPLTRNGKVDRAALPDPAAPAAGARPACPPVTPQEKAVADVFRDVLGLTEVDVTASFFDVGGDSFAAIRAVRRIPGASVGHLAAHPSVRELAAALRQTGATPGRLLRLTRPGDVRRTLVCVPFGGGSAISYQPLARALPAGTDLYAVALPGHEIDGEPDLRPLEEVAQECADAVLELPGDAVSVYGHCAGVALAVEVVRRLEAAGRAVDRLFLGASYPFYQPTALGRAMRRLRRTSEVTAATVGTLPPGPAADRAEMRYLQSIGGFAGVADDDVLAAVMRAFRHDVAEASRYFSAYWSRRGGTPPLATPITFIAGTEDPLTPRYQRRVRLWQRVSRGVELAIVPGGGHYFHQHQPEILAKIIEEGSHGHH